MSKVSNGTLNGNSHTSPSYTITNFVNNSFVSASDSTQFLTIPSPHTNQPLTSVQLSTHEDVSFAVAAAHKAFGQWSSLTTKARATLLLKLHAQLSEHAQELTAYAAEENGKTIPEAAASVAKALETLEFAATAPNLLTGKILQVSSNVYCEEMMTPLGVIASICPFNFPIMVPFWTVPIALVCGNCVVLKTSEKCSVTMSKVAEFMTKVGFPPGVFNIVNGQKECVESLCEDERVKAVTFVGSSVVAQLVHKRCTNLGKRVLSLGGAKNHLVALDDCDVEMAGSDIVSSFAGCAGQRCMAASVLIVVDSSENGKFSKKLLDEVVKKAAMLSFGTGKGCIGPVIDQASRKKILSYIDECDKKANPKTSAQLLLDGRAAGEAHSQKTGGNFIAPTVILHKERTDRALHDEIFGPVLSVHIVPDIETAIEIENNNPYGNAACVYTQSGALAAHFKNRFRAGMLGVNIGIPVPREPFSFGGLYGTRSKFGDCDITGEDALRFFTNRVKVTTKWGSFAAGKEEDKAQFK